MPTRNVNLTDGQARFLERGVRSGRYQNASEAVRAGLRLLEQQEKEDRLKLQRLRQAIDSGFQDIDEGRFEMVTADNLAEFMRSVVAESNGGRRRK
ncbi:MAG TPA: type II toxin-antitoxin system ParD family antitoxin [Humisphaera sp.]